MRGENLRQDVDRRLMGERPVRLLPSIQADSAPGAGSQQWPKAAIRRNNGAFMKISLTNLQAVDLYRFGN
jgi:hypothetical protein